MNLSAFVKMYGGFAVRTTAYMREKGIMHFTYGFSASEIDGCLSDSAASFSVAGSD